MWKKFILLTGLLISACTNSLNNEYFESLTDGIIVEKFDSLNRDENRFNLDNIVYTVGRKFIYHYYYQDTTGNQFLMTKGNQNERNLHDWYFEKVEVANPSSVNEVILTVKPGLSPFIEAIPDYNQTVIQYDFKLYDGSVFNNEMTGVIENSKNVWIHPPRTDFFKILEINPFPYIKAPFEIGNTWKWSLKFGSHWADGRWMKWEGTRENFYRYTITGKSTLATKLGKLECFITTGTAKSTLGETCLISYFNTDYGFVKLDYTNIDGTKTIMELDRVEY